jgi:hypothetical protein
MFRAAALDAATSAAVQTDDAATTASLTRYVLEEIAAAEGRVGAKRNIEHSDAGRTAALEGADFRCVDGLPLPVMLHQLVDASHQYLARKPVGRRSIGLAERARKRQQLVALEHESAEAPSPSRADDNEAAVGGGNDSSTEEDEAAARRTDDAKLDWSRYVIGAEVAVEALALIRLSSVPLTGRTAFRLMTAAFTHTTYLFALRARVALANRGGGPGANGSPTFLSAYSTANVKTATLTDVALHMAFFAGGCDEEELLSFHEALVGTLPEAMRTRLHDAEEDAKRGSSIAARRSSFAGRRRSSTTATDGSPASPEASAVHSPNQQTHDAVGGNAAEDERAAAEEAEADREYYRRGRAEDPLVVSFYYVLAELRHADSAWAAWVPERTAATQRSQARRRSLRKVSSVSTL